MKQPQLNQPQMTAGQAPWVALLVFGGFLAVVECTEKLLESEQSETGESCDCGEKASS